MRTWKHSNIIFFSEDISKSKKNKTDKTELYSTVKTLKISTPFMKQLEYLVNSESEIASVIDDFLPHTLDYKVITFTGNLGAGKTTFIKQFCQKLNSNDEASITTYSIVNEYTKKDNRIIFHMDLYRLKSLDEALDAGIDEYLNSGEYCLIEWPEIIQDLLPEKIIQIVIEKISDNQRKILIFIS